YCVNILKRVKVSLTVSVMVRRVVEIHYVQIHVVYARVAETLYHLTLHLLDCEISQLEAHRPLVHKLARASHEAILHATLQRTPSQATLVEFITDEPFVLPERIHKKGKSHRIQDYCAGHVLALLKSVGEVKGKKVQII